VFNLCNYRLHKAVANHILTVGLGLDKLQFFDSLILIDRIVFSIYDKLKVCGIYLCCNVELQLELSRR